MIGLKNTNGVKYSPPDVSKYAQQLEQKRIDQIGKEVDSLISRVELAVREKEERDRKAKKFLDLYGFFLLPLIPICILIYPFLVGFRGHREDKDKDIQYLLDNFKNK